MKTVRLLAVFALVCATRGYAQDLQYRMVMHAVMPSMPMNPPSPTMTTYQKGSAIRVDTDVQAAEGMPVMRTSMIMDMAAHKIAVLNHADKSYMELPMPSQFAKYDSTALTAAGMNPVVHETGEKKQINGYTTRRVVITVDMPSLPQQLPGAQLKEGMKVVAVTEEWLSNDPKLAEPYKAIAKSMLGASNNPLQRLLESRMPGGFPIATTIMLVQAPKTGTVDADAVLKAGDKAENLVMSLSTEAQDIRVASLDPSLFTVPADYKKQ